MSVLIKGMDMPTSCMTCLFQTPYMGGWCFLLNDNSNAYSRRRDCPLVPVPPHGRLIDAEELKVKAIERSEKCGVCVNVLDNVITVYDIEGAPTVIEADV